jgi:hypothetical protein
MCVEILSRLLLRLAVHNWAWVDMELDLRDIYYFAAYYVLFGTALRCGADGLGFEQQPVQVKYILPYTAHRYKAKKHSR